MAVEHHSMLHAEFPRGAEPVSATSMPGELRFVRRGDKRILQQQWLTVTSFRDGSRGHSGEWRDVPLVDDL